MLKIAAHGGGFIVYHSVTKKTIARFDTYERALLFIKNKP
jgi:hypothetical protein